VIFEWLLISDHEFALPTDTFAGRLVPRDRPAKAPHPKAARQVSETMQTSEVLNRAADLIEERGWWGGGMKAPVRDTEAAWWPEAHADTPVCVEGAIRLAADNAYRTKANTCHILAAYLQDGYPECANTISGRVTPFSWNDRRGRTATEVIEVLRACAVIEASREASRERQAVPA
jgi:hypothetical protein